jgi:release factor glutamine methyltransferase
MSTRQNNLLLSAASNFGDLVEWGYCELAMTSETPRLDSELLLAMVVARPRSAILGFPERAVSASCSEVFRELVRERSQGVPLAYLTGSREFYSLELDVTPDTLVPRPETEQLVDMALQQLLTSRGAGVLELGTGCGAIALALKCERPDLDVTAVDSSAAALSVARKNGARLAIDIRWLESNWYSALGDERYELIISNPPYVATSDPHFSSGLRHEPRAALHGGLDGLDAIRSILANAQRYLLPHGCVLLEHGFDQGDSVVALAREHGFEDVECHRDLSNQDRVLSARAPR